MITEEEVRRSLPWNRKKVYGKRFSEIEDRYIKEHYLIDKRAWQIAVVLFRSPSSIRTRARSLGLAVKGK